MNRRLAESISRIGFRKWYERQLLSSHGHLVLGLLSAIGLLASVEAFRGGQGDETAMLAMFVLVCAAIGAFAMRQYAFLMMRAEGAANQANCPGCGEYGRFKVVRPRQVDRDIDVCCSKCAFEWIITPIA
jgi:hypothetical protein